MSHSVPEHPIIIHFGLVMGALRFQAFQVARSDVDQVYWLDPVGALVVSCPPLPGKCQDRLVAEFSPPDVIQRARRATDPIFEVGAVVEPTFNAGVIIAKPVRVPDAGWAVVVQRPAGCATSTDGEPD